MAVFRIDKNKNYTNMSNYHFRDKRLSWKAKGILSNMLSLPEDWDYSLAGLATLASDGQSATRTALKELEDTGYLIRRPIRKDGRIADWEYLIFEHPQVKEQDVENQQVENQPQLNTNSLTTNESIPKEQKKVSKTSFDDIIAAYLYPDGQSVRFEDWAKRKELLEEWLKVRKAKRAAMTDRAIQMNIDKLDKLAAESNMSVVEYLSEVICRGWAAFFVINNYSKPAKNVGANGIAIENKPSELDGIL